MQQLHLWQFISQRLKAHQNLILLTVTASTGSSPGRQGFKMVVDETGAMAGSIGGGIMEVKLVELAKEYLKNGTTAPLLKRQIHNKTAPRDQSGMICSGEQTVVFTPLEKRDLPTVKRLIRCLTKHKPAILQISPAGIRLLEHQKNEDDYRFVSQNENEFLFEENTGFKNRLCIIGGGHCALALSELMSKMDFFIHLFDDRPDLDTLKKNRFAHEKHLLDNYTDIDLFIPTGDNVYVVVMTLGYRSDELIIRRLLSKTFKYFGVLGSASKMATLLECLQKEGVSAQKLNQIRAPIGMPINSRTPEEIAVSIAAEIIAVKNSSVFSASVFWCFSTTLTL